MLAIDRSSTQIERAGRRNEAHLASGRLSLETMDVADLDVGQTRFDKVFAVNINVFWLGPATAELAAVRRVLAPGGMLLLVYETPGPERAREVVERLSAVLEAEAFDKPEILTPTPRLVGMKMQA